ncbi:MAG TPA: M57 family metalloprotease [Kofleriaceae bacterium]|nr:M57 family metalloprotease [Kofleriaceae bacterium]
MFDKALLPAMIGSVFAFGCAAHAADEADETHEIIDNLAEAGFRPADILIADGDVYAGRDAHVTLQASREMLETGGGTAEHYRTTNLVCGKTRICINPTASFNSYSQLSQGLDLAIINYNVLPLVFDFVRGPASGCDANITITTTSGTGASSGYPSSCNPYGLVYIGTGYQSYSVDANEHIITHELGHALGLRHTDYYSHTSCGDGTADGSAGVGAVLIPGTPTGAVPGSIFNACFSPATTTGELISSDITALNVLY